MTLRSGHAGTMVGDQRAIARFDQRRDSVDMEHGSNRDDLWIGGADVDIETLLLDAGGTYRPSPIAVQTVEPAVGLLYLAARRQAFDAAFALCIDQGWLLLAPERTGSILVPERRNVGLLRRLDALNAVPDRVVVRSVDILPGQLRAIREALSSRTSLEATV
jgi:hypothetical protein